MRPAIWAIARAELRSRAASLAGLALLVALVAGVVLTAGAGARRTASSFDRFRDQTLARDARVQAGVNDRPEQAEAILAAVEALPIVEASGRVVTYPVYPDPAEVPASDLDLAIVASPDGGWGDAVDRPLVLQGRMPDPGSVSEVALNELAATDSGLGVGARFAAATFTPEDLAAVWDGRTFPGFNGPQVTLEVVGVVRQPDELSGSNLDTGPAAIATPAFVAEFDDQLGTLCCSVAVRLARGAADVEALDDAVRGLAGRDEDVSVEAASSEFGDSAADTIRVLASSLIVFAVVAGLAGVFAVGGAISRQVAASDASGPTLRALGMPRVARAIARALPIAVTVAAGTLAGAAAAIALSPLTPIGLARRAEPDPGVAVDLIVLGVGSLVVVALGAAWALAVAWRTEVSRAGAGPARRSAAAASAAGLGWGAVAVTGLRHAFERGTPPRSVPVRPALLSAVIGVAGLVGAAAVGTSLHTLVDSPARYGWAWSAEPDVEGLDEALASVAADDEIPGVAVATTGEVELDAQAVPALSIEPVRGDIHTVLRDGAQPVNATEVALGARTAEALGVGVGDTVEATKADGSGVSTLRVVGIAVFRPVDNPNPGEGALLTTEGLETLGQSEIGFSNLLLRYPPGVDRADFERRLAERHHIGFSAYTQPRVPGSIANLERTDGVIRALGLFFAVLGLAGVGHALLVSARRRRHDFAVLRTVGFVGHQVRSAVSWQAAAILAVGLVVGIPVGLAAGGAVWQVLIGDLGVIDDPTNPTLLLVLLAPAAGLAALALAWWPGRLATRGEPARILRSE